MEKEHRSTHEGEFKFDPTSVWILSFPHLKDLLVIDARPDQSLKRTLLVPQENILAKTKKEIVLNFPRLLSQTKNISEAAILLPEELRVIIEQRVVSALMEEVDFQPTSVTKKIEALPLSFLHCETSVREFWSRNQQSFLEGLGGEIDLIADVRNNVETLIESERAQIIKGGEGFHTLWQNPGLN